MRVVDLDRAPSGNFPLQNCVRWLKTHLGIGSGVQWNSEQRRAAQQAVDEAEALLTSELSPNVDTDMLRDAAYMDKIAADLNATAETLDPEDPNLPRVMAAANALTAAKAVLRHINLRIAFINWPAESYWNAGTAERPNWAPDWRDECRMLQAVMHGTVSEPRRDHDTLPHNMIPEEYRPRHLAAGELRLRKIHLAYLSIDDDLTGDMEHEGMTELAALRKFHRAVARVMDPKPGDGPVPS